MTTNNSVDLSATLEDYMEAIFHLQESNRVARVKDIADSLSITRGSVSASLKTLADRKLIDYSPYSYITLTDEGMAVSREIIRRHDVLCEFFSEVLHLESQKAKDNACRVEHAVDRAAIDQLVRFLEFLKKCPRTGESWLNNFLDQCMDNPDRCCGCMEEVEVAKRARQGGG